MPIQKGSAADRNRSRDGACFFKARRSHEHHPAPAKLRQSLWLDSISRQMLDDGRLRRYATELEVTGLTSNPTIFDEAIGGGDAYDADIARKTAEGKSGEALFTELALDDLRRAAAIFRPAHDGTQGVDGWVSMELSPLLAADTAGSVSAAARIHRAANLPNLFVKIPGTPEGVPAIEQSIFDGVPINVTLLFSAEQYLAAANAYLRGIERRLEAGRPPLVASVASLFVSRWDKAVADKVPAALRNRLGIAIAQRTYVAYRDLYESARWQKARRRRRTSAAHVVGQHRDQGSRCSGVVVRGSIRRARHHRHVAREDLAVAVATGSSATSHAHGWR